MKESGFRFLLEESDIPGSVKILIVSMLSRHGGNSITLVKEYPGESSYSINDIFIIYHPTHPKFGEVVEIGNPYAEEEFGFIEYKAFCQGISYLVDNRPYKFTSLTKDYKDRSDFDELERDRLDNL